METQLNLYKIFSILIFNELYLFTGSKWVYEKYLQRNLPKFLFLSDLSLLIVKILRAYNERTRKLFKNPHQYSLLLIMNYQPSSFRGEGSWNENLWKGKKVEISLKAGANASNISSNILVRMMDECWMKIRMLHEIAFYIWVASSNTFHPTQHVHSFDSSKWRILQLSSF